MPDPPAPIAAPLERLVTHPDNRFVTFAQTHGMTNKTGLSFIKVGTAGPFAPEVVPAPVSPATSSDAGIASALANTSSTQLLSLPAIPAIPSWIASRLGQLDLNHGSVAKYLTHLAHDATANAKTILSEVDQIADALNLDDELLDSLLVKMGLE